MRRLALGVCLIRLTLFYKEQFQIVVQEGVFGIKLDGSLIFSGSLIQLMLIVQNKAEIVVRKRVLRVKLDCFLELHGSLIQFELLP